MRKHRKLILRTIGGLLILIGVLLLTLWYLWFLPIAQRNDPLWHNQFTKIAYWDYIQNYIHRHGWTHDDFEPVGNYGDKKWAKWIIDKAAAGAELDNCGNVGHKDSALQYITNQDPASSKESDCEKAWLEWWAQNKTKSQLEWIQKGFESYNVKVSTVPSKKEQEALLILLGNTLKKKDKIHDMIPAYVKYNAFRWQRDSGFNPVDYAIHSVNKSTSKDVIKGLGEYQKLYEVYPKGDYVGILPFSDNGKNNYDDYPRPHYFRLGVKITVYSIMILPIVIGIFLLLWSTRKKKESKYMKRIATILSVCTGSLFFLALVSCVWCSIAERDLPKGGANIGLGVLYITLLINIPTLIVWGVYFFRKQRNNTE